MFKTILGSLLLVFLSPSTSVEPTGSEPPKHPNGVEEKQTAPQEYIEQHAARWLEEYDIPSVAIAFIEDGQVAWTSVFGEQRPGVPATNRTLYNIASMAKPISAEVVLRLAAAGEFSIDASMEDHWVDPDIQNNPWHRLLTPRICLSHQTGFPNWRYQTDDVLSFRWEPGTRSGYSGEGYEYAAQFAQNKTGVRFDELAKKLVFDPCGMADTSYIRKAWFEDRIAFPKGPEGEYGEPTIRDSWVASDDLYSTASDYARFMLSAMNNDKLSPDLIKVRQSVQVDKTESLCTSEKNKVKTCPVQAGTGLGWNIWKYEKETVFWHTGGDWGEETIGFFIPEQESGVVIFTNGTNGMRIMPRITKSLFPELAFNEFLEYQAR